MLGDNNVIVSLFTEETKNNVNNFGLRPRPPGDTRHSILCERGKVLTRITVYTYGSLLAIITRYTPIDAY